MADRASNPKIEGKKAEKGKAKGGATGRRRKGEPEEETTTQRRKELEASIRLQVAAEEKAHKIVEKLVLDERVPREVLLTSGNFITPSHYSDVTQERSIACICGYPLCSNPLTQIPKQKYKISTRTNRVYDITERKCFCSSFCYKASKWFESQLLSSPVWTRAQNEPSEFTLLSDQDEMAPNQLSAGDVFIGSSRTGLLESDIDKDPSRSRDKGRLDEGLEHIQESNQELNQQKDMRDTNSEIQNLAANIDLVQVSPAHGENMPKSSRIFLPDKPHPTCVATQTNSINSGQRSVQTSSHANNEEELPSREKEGTVDASDSREQLLVRSVMQVASEWCTSATLRFLDCGQSRSPDEEQRLTGDDSEWFKERALRFFEANHNREDFDADELDSTRNKLSPENIVIKERQLVREEQEAMRVIPPIDCKSQMTIRRRIVLSKLTQALPNVLREVKLTMGEVSADLTQLVHTFRLGNHNITLKPVQWNVLGLVLLETLRCRNLLIAAALDSAKEQAVTLLRIVGLTRPDLDSIVAVFRPAASGGETGTESSLQVNKARIDRRGRTANADVVEHYGKMEELD